MSLPAFLSSLSLLILSNHPLSLSSFSSSTYDLSLLLLLLFPVLLFLLFSLLLLLLLLL